MVSLIDALLRQQIYFEMWKGWESLTYEQKIAATVAAIIMLIKTKAPADSFKDISLTQTEALAVIVVDRVRKENVKTESAISRLLNETLVTVTAVTLANYNKTVGLENGRKRMASPRTARVEEIMNEPVAGTGLKPLQMIREFNNQFVTNARSLIMRAYAEKWSVNQLVGAIRGTVAKGYADGMLSRQKQRVGAVVNTLMQHAQAWCDYNIGRLFHKFYQWCSVLDAATTPICRERHRKVYEYGKGPVPPAHYRCRSRIMGVDADAGNQMPNAFYDWLVTQPPPFLRDVLLPEEYQRIREGNATRADFPKYTNRKTATRATFEKRALIGEIDNA